MRVLELFSGTGSVSKVCEELGYEVVSVDITDKLHKPTHKADILHWDYKVYPPGHFDVVWASPPCRTFSALRRISKTRDEIERDIREIGLPILRKTEEIIQYFKPARWFIENPQSGRMKDFLELPFYDVDYCMFSDWGYRKRTRIWTNVDEFEPKLCDKACGNIENGKHRARIGYPHVDTKLLYRVPPALINALLQSLQYIPISKSQHAGGKAKSISSL